MTALKSTPIWDDPGEGEGWQDRVISDLKTDRPVAGEGRLRSTSRKVHRQECLHPTKPKPGLGGGPGLCHKTSETYANLGWLLPSHAKSARGRGPLGMTWDEPGEGWKDRVIWRSPVIG